jgi:hypothetical protein
LILFVARAYDSPLVILKGQSRRRFNEGGAMDENTKDPKANLELEIEVLEERIAPDVTGLGGYEGQPGNQGGHGGNGLNGYEGQPGNQGG